MKEKYATSYNSDDLLYRDIFTIHAWQIRPIDTVHTTALLVNGFMHGMFGRVLLIGPGEGRLCLIW